VVSTTHTAHYTDTIGKSRRITDAHLAAFVASLEGDDAA
jgi:hypothetical protein